MPKSTDLTGGNRVARQDKSTSVAPIFTSDIIGDYASAGQIDVGSPFDTAAAFPALSRPTP